MLIGIDVGTTNLKAALYDPESGRVEASVRVSTPTHRPRAGWAEFHADELWRATAECLRELMRTAGPRSVEGVAIGSMGESGVLLDAHMQPLGPMIAWFDRRSEPQVDWWRTQVDAWTIYSITGQLLDSKFSVNHMLWFRQTYPDIFKSARRWLCVPDYLVWKLSGEQATDRTLAARTMLFDQRHHAWSPELLALADLPTSLLPGIVESGTAIGKVTSGAAAQTGLPPGTPVVTGGHDHLVGALAAGVLHPGDVLDSTGTAIAVLQLTDAFAPSRALFDAGLETSAFTRPDTYLVLASNNLGGGAAEWLARLLWDAEPEATAAAFAAAEAVPVGSDGVVWLPHLLGSGTPAADPGSRAAIVGLRPEHTRGHLVRALLEGLAFWLRENLEVAASHVAAGQTSEVVAIGGATRSAFWTQLKADISQCTFCAPRLEESVALGAALLAGTGAGTFASLEQAVASVNVERPRFAPRAESARVYDAWYRQVYLRLYPALKDVNATIEILSRVSE